MKKIILPASILLSGTAYAQVSQNPAIVLQSSATVYLPRGSALCAVAVADFNADNKADVAVCEQGLDQIGVYLQTTPGTFPSVAATYPAGISPSGLVVGQLTNQPNHPPADLIAVSSQSYRWTMLVNDVNAIGSFTPVSNPPGFGTSQMSTNPQLVTAHINRDNYSDFAYTYVSPNQNRVKWDGYVGGARFNISNYYEPPFAPTSLALDDFDRDGYTDVAFTNTAGSEVWVVFASPDPIFGNPYWNNGQAQYAQIPSVGRQPVDVATGDLNRDLLPDLAVASSGSSFATVFLNTGGPTRFGTPFTYPLSAPARKVLLADLNEDGNPELLAVTTDNKLQVFQHTGAAGSGRYNTPQVLATGVNPNTLQAVDMNGDGVKDIVVGCIGDNSVRIYLNRSLAQPTAARATHLAGVSVYPNPATDQLFVRSSHEVSEPFAATLIDGLGRTVRELQVQPNATAIPVADLPRGLYTLRLTGTDGTITSRVMLH